MSSAYFFPSFLWVLSIPIPTHSSTFPTQLMDKSDPECIKYVKVEEEEEKIKVKRNERKRNEMKRNGKKERKKIFK